MSYRRISNYMGVGFIGGLGLFNSSKLEIRQLTDTNAELFYQNGQIISSAIIVMCAAGLLAEILILKNRKNKTSIRTSVKEKKKDTLNPHGVRFGGLPTPTNRELTAEAKRLKSKKAKAKNNAVKSLKSSEKIFSADGAILE